MQRSLLVAGSALVLGTLAWFGRGAPPASRPATPPGVAVAPATPIGTPTPPAVAAPSTSSDLDGKAPPSALLLARAFDLTVDVEPMPKPGPADWLSNHEEPGQTYEEWKDCARHEPDARRFAIRLMPLGDLGTDAFPSIDVLASYAEAFFAMPARPIPAPRVVPVFSSRTNGTTGQRQILSTDVLRWLRRGLPPDAFCSIALTTTDLYPEPGWNYVFGQASFVDRTGVFSFARYDPRFYGEKRLEGSPTLVLRRSLKVMAHEIGHMFGIEHCIRFRCLMNGSNHLGETDASPMDVCPVCLRKLQHAIGFDPLTRERALEAWRRSHGLLAEADRSAARIARWTR